MDDFIEAGKITAKAREYAKSIIKEGMNIYDYVVKIEKKINDLGGKIAFPVNISINEEAAHNTADFEGEDIFKKGDVVKVDIGAQVDGYVGDTAFTVEISTNRYKQLIEATKKALDAAIQTIKPDVEIREIGSTIEKVIHEEGYVPIVNLGGHGVGRYDLHQGLFIPNYDNGNRTKLRKGQTIAIEPFATDGDGYVVGESKIKIFCLKKPKPTRMMSSRKILNYIKKEFNTLPFAQHHLLQRFKPYEVTIALKELIANGSLETFPVLREKGRGIVSQAEHTLIVDDEPIVTTKI